MKETTAVDHMQGAAFQSTSWPDEVIQLLDDHHLVVLSGAPRVRREFARTLARRLVLMPETQVLELDGEAATDLPDLCRQLERQLEGRLRRRRAMSHVWWRDVQNLIALLRRPVGGPAPAGASRLRQPRRRFKHQYIIWREAHLMLESDVALFGRVVNAMLGVAAEREHISPAPLLIQRIVFIGHDKLGAYAEDSRGQFCRWFDEEEGSPLWEVASVLERPPVMTYRIEG